MLLIIENKDDDDNWHFWWWWLLLLIDDYKNKIKNDKVFSRRFDKSENLLQIKDK